MSLFKKRSIIGSVLLVLSLTLTSCVKNKKNQTYQTLTGDVFGTTFLVKYQDEKQRVFEVEVQQIFHRFNASLSTYDTNSKISKFNRGLKEMEIENDFKAIVLLSKKVYQNTNGFFDPSIGLMVNAWGFGTTKPDALPTPKEVDRLMQFVGYDQISLQGQKLIKKNTETVLDFNAIAKGYGVDLIGLFLEEKGIQNYLVEIGGEIRARGVNAKDAFWAVGIEEPNFDGSRSVQKVIQLKNQSIATSGNYRKYKIDRKTGDKYAHTLNPKTGFPAQTDLLSVSVIGDVSCAEVDAYATALMAMGFDKAKHLAHTLSDFKVYFIYLENNKIKTLEVE